VAKGKARRARRGLLRLLELFFRLRLCRLALSGGFIIVFVEKSRSISYSKQKILAGK